MTTFEEVCNITAQHTAELFFTCFSVEYVLSGRVWAVPLLVVSVFLWEKFTFNYLQAVFGVSVVCAAKYVWAHSLAVVALLGVGCSIKAAVSTSQSPVLPVQKVQTDHPVLSAALDDCDATSTSTCLYLF